MDVSQEFVIVAETMAVGGVVGLAVDLYRLVRRVLRPGRLGTLLGDLAFWLVLTPLVLTGLVLINGGELRAYVGAGIALGAFLYFRWLSRPFLAAAIAVGRGVGRATRGLEIAAARAVGTGLERLAPWREQGWLGGQGLAGEDGEESGRIRRTEEAER